MNLRLIPIDRSGVPSDPALQLNAVARQVCDAFAPLYQAAGFTPPWLGYLAVVDGLLVGSCGFKSPPNAGEVEIAYFTFPDFEGRGIASALAAELVAIATSAAPSITVTAQTLPERNRSVRILERLGFTRRRELVHPDDGPVWEWERTPKAPS